MKSTLVTLEPEAPHTTLANEIESLGTGVLK